MRHDRHCLLRVFFKLTPLQSACIQRYNSHILQSWRLGHLSQLLCHCIQNKQNGLGVFGGRILELGLLYKERRDDTTIYIISNDISSLNSSLPICLNLENMWIIDIVQVRCWVVAMKAVSYWASIPASTSIRYRTFWSVDLLQLLRTKLKTR